MWNNIKNSFYNPEFYKNVRSARVKTTLKYFFEVILLLSFVLAIVRIPMISAFFSPNTIDMLTNLVPADLTLTIKNGQASTNVAEPYTVPFPADWNINSRRYTNLIVIDTKTPYTPEQFDAFDTLILIKKNFMVTSNQQNGGQANAEQITEFKNIANFTLSRQVVTAWGNNIKPYLPLVTLVVTILLFIFHFVLYCFYFVYLLIAALIIWLIGTIKKFKLSYGTSYKVGIYAIVPILFIKALLEILHTGFLPFVFTFLLIVLCAINFTADVEIAVPASNPETL